MGFWRCSSKELIVPHVSYGIPVGLRQHKGAPKGETIQKGNRMTRDPTTRMSWKLRQGVHSLSHE